MTAAEARALRQNDKVDWEWTRARTVEPTPGTITGLEPDGVYIYWADSGDLPTFYPYDDPDSWPSITNHTPELVYIPDDDQRAPISKRRKRKS